MKVKLLDLMETKHNNHFDFANPSFMAFIDNKLSSLPYKIKGKSKASEYPIYIYLKVQISLFNFLAKNIPLQYLIHKGSNKLHIISPLVFTYFLYYQKY